jgi:hypothetical protein
MQDLAAQREALAALGVPAERIYLDRGLTGTARARPGLDKTLARQQAELRRMHDTGEDTIAELMEVFSVGRATVYCVLGRDIGGSAATVGGDTA